MGELIDLQLRRAARSAGAAAAVPAFYFDVSSPASYLVAEGVERALGQAEWVAVDGSAIGAVKPGGQGLAAARAHAEAQARALRLPLVWPDELSFGGRRAMRAASFACELGAGAAFAVAAGRLAFCGGFDLDDPETLAEAAAAAGIPLAACLGAASESWRDDELSETARMLWAEGVNELPAISVAGHWFGGVAGLLAVGAQLRHGGLLEPLAPVG